jgi:hypothetical protein
MAENRPQYNVCLSKANPDKKTPSRCTNVGAAWVGEEKGQVNVRLHFPPRAIGELLADGYEFVLFVNGDPEEENAQRRFGD